MMNKVIVIGSLASLGFWLGLSSAEVLAQMPHETIPHTVERPEQFQHIEQPLWVKGAVTLGGLGLIGVELWWFLFSKPKSRSATPTSDISV
jgi:plastocyanin domain-containing protein